MKFREKLIFGAAWLAVLLTLPGTLQAAIESSAWLSYQTRHEETLDQYGQQFTSICVFAYDFDENDNLRPAQPWVDDHLAALMATSHPNRPVFVTIVNDIESNPPQQHNGDLILRILSDPAKRAQHISQIVTLSAKADGVDIDYEGLLTGTRPYYTQFIQELRAALPQGKLLSVVCQPKTNNSNGPRGNAIDWRAIHPHVDILKVMTYYYSFGASAPGASAPLDKVRDVTRLAVSQVPLEKLHIVLTQFGWDWPENSAGRFVAFEEAMQVGQSHGAAAFRDAGEHVMRFNYSDQGTPHQIWFDDKQSLLDRIAIIQNEGVNKVDFWELGVGDPDFWPWLAQNTVNPGGNSNPNPVPVISSISPSTESEGAAGFTLTVTGSDFVSDSVLRWNNQDRTTTFTNSTTLTAVIPASDVASASTPTVTVFNPAPGGGTSNGVPFVVEEASGTSNPVPSISSLNPSSATAGSGSFTMTVTGADFMASTVIKWNGDDRTTTFVDVNTLQVNIPASDLSNVGSSTITAVNPGPGGGTSNEKIFIVYVVPNPIPTIQSLNPTSTSAGGPAFILTVSGTKFVAGSVVQWNNQDRTTTYVSSISLTAEIPATDILLPSTALVRVFNPAPGGGLSATRAFPVTLVNPAPALSSISPSSAAVSGPTFTLTALGSNFTTDSVLRWNGDDRTTTFVNAGKLTAQIPAGDIGSVGSASIVIFTPAPGGGTSSTKTFTIYQPVIVGPAPVINSFTPSSIESHSSDFTLDLFGDHFQPASKIRWSGTDKTTTFVSSQHLRARILATDVSQPGRFMLSVVNADGQTSSENEFQVTNAAVAAPVLIGPLATDLNAARAYPNPWMSSSHNGRSITFDSLTPDATIKLFTISSQWVRSLSSNGGTTTWDLRNDDGEAVASGYYIYLITDGSGNKKSGKVAIVK